MSTDRPGDENLFRPVCKAVTHSRERQISVGRDNLTLDFLPSRAENDDRDYASLHSPVKVIFVFRLSRTESP